MYSKATDSFLTIDLDTMREPGFIEMMIRLRDSQIERVHAKRGFKETSSCPLCRGLARETFAEINDWLTVEKCNQCEYAYASHFPNFVEDVYDSEQYLDSALNAYDRSREYRKKRFGSERIGIIGKYFETGSILDIGCGTGWFLEAARDAGYSVAGQELSSQLAEFTSEKFKLQVHNKEVNEIHKKFDVVTMFDLIEHVPDPLKLLHDCNNLLQTGGIILVFTPNLDSHGITEMREFSSLVTPPSHLHYFTPKSVQILSEKEDMDLVMCETRGMDVADLAAYEEYKGNNEIGKYLRDSFESIQPCIDASGCGNHMRFVLKKN